MSGVHGCNWNYSVGRWSLVPESLLSLFIHSPGFAKIRANQTIQPPKPAGMRELEGALYPSGIVTTGYKGEINPVKGRRLPTAGHYSKME